MDSQFQARPQTREWGGNLNSPSINISESRNLIVPVNILRRSKMLRPGSIQVKVKVIMVCRAAVGSASNFADVARPRREMSVKIMESHSWMPKDQCAKNMLSSAPDWNRPTLYCACICTWRRCQAAKRFLGYHLLMRFCASLLFGQVYFTGLPGSLKWWKLQVDS